MAADHRYSRISRRMWRDEKFRSLTGPKPNARDLWIFLLTGPHCTSIPGLFVLGEASMAEELDWPLPGTRVALEELEKAGMVQVDRKTRLVWIPKAILHNKPSNQNMVTGWRLPWAELPDCQLKREAKDALRAVLWSVDFSDEIREGFLRAMGEAPPAPSTNPAGFNKEQRSNRRPKTSPNGSVDRSQTVNERLPTGSPTQEQEPEKETSRLRADAPSQAREGSTPAKPDSPPDTDDEPPAGRKAEPVEVVVEHSAKPRLVPAGFDFEALLTRMSKASGFKFDSVAYTAEQRDDLTRRFIAYGVDDELADEMGLLLGEPMKVWPWADRIKNGRTTVAWLVGKGGHDGSKAGQTLAHLVGMARDVIAARARAAAAAKLPPAPRPAPLPEMSPADRLAAIARITARRAAAPGPVPATPPADAPEVTCG